MDAPALVVVASSLSGEGVVRVRLDSERQKSNHWFDAGECSYSRKVVDLLFNFTGLPPSVQSLQSTQVFFSQTEVKDLQGNRQRGSKYTYTTLLN